MGRRDPLLVFMTCRPTDMTQRKSMPRGMPCSAILPFGFVLGIAHRDDEMNDGAFRG